MQFMGAGRVTMRLMHDDFFRGSISLIFLRLSFPSSSSSFACTVSRVRAIPTSRFYTSRHGTAISFLTTLLVFYFVVTFGIPLSFCRQDIPL